jgi:hypothetical protein
MMRTVGKLALLARNLVAQMLNNDAAKRPNMNQVMAHPFFTGKTAARMVGEDAEFDVFLSYRVASEAKTVEVVYDALTAAGIKVWWDKLCLKAGE